MTARTPAPIRVTWWRCICDTCDGSRIVYGWQCRACPARSASGGSLFREWMADAAREHLRERHPELCAPRPLRVGHVLHLGDPEPPEGTIVLDSTPDVDAWRGDDCEWISTDHGLAARPWVSLLDRFGPVTVAYVPPPVTS